MLWIIIIIFFYYTKKTFPFIQVKWFIVIVWRHELKILLLRSVFWKTLFDVNFTPRKEQKNPQNPQLTTFNKYQFFC